MPNISDLDDLIERARNFKMTPGQAEAQRRSFAYGTANIENSSITFETVNVAAREVELAREKLIRERKIQRHLGK